MNLVATLEAMVEAGATAEMLLAVVRRHEAEREAAREERRAKDAHRQREHRARVNAESQGVTVTGRDSREPSPRAGAGCAQVVNPSSSSLRSEEGENPIPPNGGIDPLKAKSPPIAKPNGFARFWEAYPNKVAKVAAEKAYAKALKAIPGPDPPGVILAGVERAKVSRQWREGFIPHPATWLNRGCWDDEPAEISPTPGKAHERHHPDPKSTARADRLERSLAGLMAAVDEHEGALDRRRAGSG